ncbi:MAG: hypothetical protein V4714_11415 [Bacteroidota bacterium]
MKSHPFFSPFEDEAAGENAPLGQEESDVPASTDLVFQDYAFDNGTRMNFCFSEDGGNTCETILHEGVSYQVNMQVFNVGSTLSTDFTVQVRLEPDGFFTTEDDFSPVEMTYDGQSIPANQVDGGANVTLPALQKGQHYNLKAQLLVNGEPLPHSGAATSYDNFEVSGADTDADSGSFEDTTEGSSDTSSDTSGDIDTGSGASEEAGGSADDSEESSFSEADEAMTPIRQKAQTLLENGFDVGASLGSEVSVREGGSMERFEHATIIYHPALGAFELHGEILAKYEEDGGVDNGSIGYPVSDEINNPASSDGRMNEFQFGKITWSASEGAVIVTEEPTDSAGEGDTNQEETIEVQGQPVGNTNPESDSSAEGNNTGASADASSQGQAPTSPPASLSPLSDVTDRVLREINLVPGGNQRPGTANRAFDVGALLQEKMAALPDDADKSTWQALLLGCEDNNIPILDSWDSRPLSAVSKLTAQATSDPNEFRIIHELADFTGADAFQVVLERSGDVHPKLLAVSFPKSLLEQEKTPFLIYFHPTLGQAVSSGYYTAASNLKSPEDNQFYPYGWDFLFHVFWKYLNYTDREFNTAYSLGLNYQVGLSGKDVAIVLPIFHPNDNINVGDFNQPDKILTLLGEIKWFFTQQVAMNGALPSPDNFRVAMGAFSSSNNLLANLINKTQASFCKDVLKEVYFFDPPQGIGDSCIAAALNWARNDQEKHIRFYSQWSFGTHSQILSNKKSVQSPKLVLNPDNPRRSAALLGQSFWETIVNAEVLKDIQSRGWAAVHSLIPSTMLVDALQRSDF